MSMPDLNWKIGGILHFVNYLAKTKGKQQYCDLSTEVSDKNIGVLCSWYILVDTVSRKFSLSDNAVSHVHMSISKYFCTLPGGCFEESESAIFASNIGKMDPGSMKTLTMKSVNLTSNVMSGIQNIFRDSNPPMVPIKQKQVSLDNETKHETQRNNNNCIECGTILLISNK